MRIRYVDGFRGFALLSMVLLHIFDALSVTSVYTDPPIFIKELNTIIINIPALFMIVSGMSAYLFLNNSLKTNTKKETVMKALKTYAKYILLSLPFTIFMWGLPTYLEWNEAIQGIGLSAIIITLIMTYLKPRNYELAISTILLTLARGYILQTQPLSDAFPYNPSLNNPLQLLGSVAINATYRGWFSILNLVPLMMGGILFYKATRKYSVKKLLTGCTILTIISLYLHFNGTPIDYYGKSVNLTLFALSTSCMMLTVIKALYDKLGNVNFLTKAGMSSLGIYVWHQLLILKPIQALPIKDAMPELIAFIIAIPLTWSIYMLVRHVRITLKPSNATVLKQQSTPTNS